MPPESYNTGSDRAERIQAVLSDCLMRRSRGEDLSDDAVITSHADLMPELLGELSKLRLIHAAREAAERLAPADDSSAALGATSQPVFEGYEVVRELHRGGQGIVYQAIQRTTQRKVAIKLLSAGRFADARSQARWQREIRILGQLHHPNIVRLHDGGKSATGPYYVMDYIAGEALDVYIQRRRPELREVVRLFEDIAGAVQAMHLRGVIHRDLKPDNVRVDAHGKPYLLDFGLARVAAEALTDDPDARLLSMTGQFIGTAAWASPEQAAGRIDQVDMRTDIHAIGLMLHQALAGRMPYDVTGSARQVLDTIIAVEPARLRSVNPAIDEDLETIVLKCLEKEPGRRYQSASNLIDDLEHYAKGEPIEARRNSAMYMLRKMLRRYRAAALAALAFVAAISVFATAMTLLYQRAEYEARKGEIVAGFLESVFAAVDPVEAQGRDNTFLREALDEAVLQLDELGSAPEAEARVRHIVGQTYLRLGMYEAAADHLRTAFVLRREQFGAGATETAATGALLGEALLELEEYEEAERLLVEARRVQEEGQKGADRLILAGTLDGLAHLYFVQSDYVAAEPLLREALALRREYGASPVETAQSLANLGSLLRNQERFEQAEPLLREALSICQRQLGPQHVHTIIAMNKLMLLLKMRGDYEAALELGREALALRITVDGERHPHVGVSHFNLARTYAAAEMHEAAAEHFGAALEIWRSAYPVDHSDATRAIVDMATCRQRLGDFEAAEELLLDRQRELQAGGVRDVGQLRYIAAQLTKLYEEWSRPEAAARWRVELTDETPE